MRTLTLISHHLCPYVQRAAIALAEKGVAFERITIDLREPPDWFGALSPLGKVPILVVRESGGEETVLFESSVICEYIEETETDIRLHPIDPLERARHRSWMEFGSTILSDIWILETAQDAEKFAASRDQIAARLGRLERVLGQGPWFGGGAFSLVDAFFAPVFRYFDTFDEIAELGVFDGLTNVGRWRSALSQRKSVKEAVDADYGDRLRAFLVERDAFLLRAEVTA